MAVPGRVDLAREPFLKKGLLLWASNKTLLSRGVPPLCHRPGGQSMPCSGEAEAVCCSFVIDFITYRILEITYRYRKRALKRWRFAAHLGHGCGGALASAAAWHEPREKMLSLPRFEYLESILRDVLALIAFQVVQKANSCGLPLWGRMKRRGYTAGARLGG